MKLCDRVRATKNFEEPLLTRAKKIVLNLKHSCSLVIDFERVPSMAVENGILCEREKQEKNFTASVVLFRRFIVRSS